MPKSQPVEEPISNMALDTAFQDISTLRVDGFTQNEGTSVMSVPLCD